MGDEHEGLSKLTSFGMEGQRRAGFFQAKGNIAIAAMEGQSLCLVGQKDVRISNHDSLNEVRGRAGVALTSDSQLSKQPIGANHRRLWTYLCYYPFER